MTKEDMLAALFDAIECGVIERQDFVEAVGRNITLWNLEFACKQLNMYDEEMNDKEVQK